MPPGPTPDLRDPMFLTELPCWLLPELLKLAVVFTVSILLGPLVLLKWIVKYFFKTFYAYVVFW